jgi:hypothetical protein
MKIKKILSCCLISCSILTSCGTSNNKYDFTYTHESTKEYSSYSYYQDNYFSDDGSKYNPSLSTCSLSLALSCSRTLTSDLESKTRYLNGSNLLENYGFNDVYVNDGFINNPTTTSVGLIFARKTINNKTLIVVGVSGGNFGLEIVNNFKVGDGSVIKGHQGFYEASEIYLKELQNYIDKYNISGEIKLWSVGYSRGGAINNIALGRIDKMIKDNNSSLFANKVTLNKQDVYGYCFDSMLGASTSEEISPKDKIYSNIHNVISTSNPYTKLAFKELGFTRYGVDYYLPSISRNVNYDSFLNRMKSIYNGLASTSDLGDYCIDEFEISNDSYDILESSRVYVNYDSSLFLDDLGEFIAYFGVQSVENYANKYQEGLMELFELIYKNGSLKFSLMTLGMSLVRYLINSSNVDILINNLFHDPEVFMNDFIVLIRSTLINLGLNIEPQILMECLKSTIKMVVSLLMIRTDLVSVFMNTTNIKSIISATYPEVCLASLMALDPNYGNDVISYSNDGSYYYLYVPKVTKETKITVLDENNNVVGTLQDGVISQDSPLSCGSYNGNCYFILPVEQQYSIKIENASEYDLSYFDQTNFDDLVLFKANKDVKEENIVTKAYPTKA